MERKKQLRKIFFVDKKNQSKYIAFVGAYLLSYIVILNLVLYFPILHTLSSKDASLMEQEKAAALFFSLETNYLPFMLLLMVLFCLHTLTVTHKFFGPIFRVKMLLKQMSEGDLSIKCHFRKSDYLFDLRDSFNEMLGSLNGLVKEISQRNKKNSLALSEVASELRKDDFAKDQLIQKIDAIQDRIKKNDGSFKLAP